MKPYLMEKPRGIMKKNLLLNSNSRTFLQIFGPLIPKLAEEFDIVIFLTILRNIIFPQSLITMCSSWEKEGIAISFFNNSMASAAFMPELKFLYQVPYN